MPRSLALALTLGASLLSTGCWVGARNPTGRTQHLHAELVEFARADTCAQDWLTGDPDEDLALAFDALDRLGVKVVQSRTRKLSRARRNRLVLERDFDERSTAHQVAVLVHELVHYCDRQLHGDHMFEGNYVESSWRWAYEIRAYAQAVRAAALYGYDADTMEDIIGRYVDLMRDTYWLHDI